MGSESASGGGRTFIAVVSLILNLFVGCVGLFFSTRLLSVLPVSFAMKIAALSFLLGALLLLCNAGAVVLNRSGQLPMAFSRRRRLLWCAIAAIAFAMIAFIVASQHT